MKVTADRPVRVRILDESGQLRQMPDILSDLKARYGDTLDAFEAAEIKEAFGTDEAMKMINALYGQEAAVRANANALADAARQGAAFTEGMAANVDDYDGAGWDRFQQQMKTIKEQIGAGLLPAMDKLAPVFAGMAETVGGFIERNPGLVAGLGAAIVGLSGIATVAAPVLFARFLADRHVCHLAAWLGPFGGRFARDRYQGGIAGAGGQGAYGSVRVFESGSAGCWPRFAGQPNSADRSRHRRRRISDL